MLGRFFSTDLWLFGRNYPVRRNAIKFRTYIPFKLLLQVSWGFNSINLYHGKISELH